MNTRQATVAAVATQLSPRSFMPARIFAKLGPLLAAMLTAVCICAPCTAQQSTRADRHASSWDHSLPVFLCEPLTRTLKVSYPKGVEFSLTIPIDFPARAHEIRNASGVLSDVLLGGKDTANQGVLCWVQVTAPNAAGWSLASTLTIPSADLVGAAYSADLGRIYVYDAVSGAVSAASWSPPDPLPVATQWSIVASAVALGFPAHPDMQELVRLDEGPPYKMGLLRAPYYRVSKTNPVVIDDGAAITVQIANPPGTRAPAIQGARLSVDQTEVHVRGEANVPVDFVRVDAGATPIVVASGVLDGTGTATLILPAGSLRAGTIYAARTSTGGVGAPYFAAMRFWGNSADFLNGMTPQPWDSIGNTCYVGSPYFQAYMRVEEGQPASIYPWSAPATLILGDVTSSIVEVNGVSLLVGTHFLTGTLHFSTADLGGSISAILPLPADPLLAGGEVRMQWVFPDADTLALSEIAGTTIRAQPWIPPGNEGVAIGNQGHSFRSGGSDSGGEGRNSLTKTRRTWMRSIGAAVLTRQTIQEWIRRLERRKH